MHLYHRKAEHNRCLICFKDVNHCISINHLLHDERICLECMNKFEISGHVLDFHHYPLRILYKYNSFFQSLLYQYKGLYDLALKDAFLSIYYEELKRKYRDYMIIVVPSSNQENLNRGFSPMKEIALTLHSDVFTGLYKKSDYKQSLLTFNERRSVKGKIGIENGELIKGRKVLILDDVITSGSTMEACLSLIEACLPKTIEMLVLSSNHF